MYLAENEMRITNKGVLNEVIVKKNYKDFSSRCDNIVDNTIDNTKNEYSMSKYISRRRDISQNCNQRRDK